MKGSDIFEQLSLSDNWGSNDQPSIYWATAILEQLPVNHLVADNDRLQIGFSRELTQLEHWAIDSLAADDISGSKEDGLVNLWWD